MEPRTLSDLIADMTATLQAGAVSSQLDATTVTAFAGLSLLALSTIDATLQAIDAPRVEAAVTAAADLAESVAGTDGQVKYLATEVSRLKTEAVDAAGQLDELRRQLSDLRGQLDAAKP